MAPPSTGANPSRISWRSHGLVVVGFLALAALLWWPLPLHFGTHVPGVPQWAYDEATFVWNIWHFKNNAVDTLSSPLHSELVYFPLGVDLILYTYNFFHVLAALPLALAVSLPFASNALLLLSTALSGYGTWLLVRYVLHREGVDGRAAMWAGLVAGAIFAFASNRSIYAALGHYDMVTTQWIPFYALALLRSLDGRLPARARRSAALLAGLFFAFNGLAEMITALFLAIFTLIVLLAYPRDDGDTRPLVLEPRRWLPSLALTGVVAFALWSPVLIPILVAFLTDDFALKGWGEAVPLSADLLGWFTPTVLHPLFGSDLVAELRRVQLRALEGGVKGFRDLNTVFLGWVTAALALLGWVTWRRRVRIWLWTAIVFGLFTLGPFLQINGEYRFDLDGIEASVPLPYALLHYLPIIKANRAPNRNSVVLMLALAVLAGYAVAWLLAWWRQRQGARGVRWAAALPLIAGALVIGEHLVAPLPLTDMRVPAVYAQIAADPRPVSVLQVPLGWRNSFGVLGPEATILQYYQSAHGKPMLGGNTSRAPDFKMEYFRRLPWFRAMTDVQFGREITPELRRAAEEQAGELMALYDVGYVLLFPPVPDRPPYSDTWQKAWQFAKETLPLEDEPFWAQDGIEAYKVIQPARDPEFRLDLGAPSSFAYRGEGWDGAETDTIDGESALWATGRESVLFAPLQPEPGAPYQVTLRLRAPESLAGRAQGVALQANGVQVGARQSVGGAWQEVTWELPAGAFADGLNRLELIWDEAVSPRAAQPGSRAIGSTGVEMPVDADLKAFDGGGFIALFDDEGEQQDASAGRRGLNLTLLDPRTGAVLSMQGFDTAANAYESAAFAEAVAAIPAGRIALVVSSGADALAQLTPDAVAALHSLGAPPDLDLAQGKYLTLAGVKGAASGSAALELAEGEAFLRVSLERDRRPLAAAVDWVRIQPR